MILHFPTYEDAALFAAEQAEDGVDAVVLDGCVSSLWGPAAVGGVRVLVLGEHRDEPEEIRNDRRLQVFRIGIVVLTVTGLFVLGISVLSMIIENPRWVLRWAIAGVLVVSMAAWMAPRLAVFLRGGTGSRQALGLQAVKWFVALAAFAAAIIGILR